MKGALLAGGGAIDPDDELQHWRGFQAENALNTAPMLEFADLMIYPLSYKTRY